MNQKLMEKTSLDTQSFILSKSPLHVTSKKAKVWIYLITILLRQEKIALHRREEVSQRVTLHYITLHFSGHSAKHVLSVQRLPGLAMAALNLLVLLCTGISELDLGVSSLGRSVAQSQL